MAATMKELVQAQCRKSFLTQSELIRLVLPQAAQLDIHLLLYFFHNTQLEMSLLFERLDKRHSHW